MSSPAESIQDAVPLSVREAVGPDSSAAGLDLAVLVVGWTLFLGVVLYPVL